MKEKEIFRGFGCLVIRRKRRYFVRFDSGGFASRMIELEITKKETKEIQKSEQAAYETLLKVQKRDALPSNSCWFWRFFKA